MSQTLYSCDSKQAVEDFESKEPVSGDLIMLPQQRVCVIPETIVAGTSHASQITTIARDLAQGSGIVLRRDVDNVFDEWAIEVTDSYDRHIGFVSCEYNEILSRLIDGGISVDAEYRAVQQVNGWTKITMAVYVCGK